MHKAQIVKAIAFLEKRDKLSKELECNLKIRAFIQDIGRLTDENDKLLLIDEHKDLFVDFKSFTVLGTDLNSISCLLYISQGGCESSFKF